MIPGGSYQWVCVLVVLVVFGLISEAQSELEPTRKSISGPWGSLEYENTYLEAPEDIVALFPVPSQTTIWRFIGMSPEEVCESFLEAGISQRFVEQLKSSSEWYSSTEETRVEPDHSVLVKIIPESRAKIYKMLGQWKENPFHRHPKIIDSNSTENWLDRAGLPAEIVELVGSLAYPQGKESAFSDIPLVLARLETQAMERRFLKAITRSSSLMLHLRLDPGIPVAELMNYWSARDQYRETVPLLQSALKAKGLDYIDIAHLLPPIPRKHLFTYPSIASGQSGQYPDSFWLVFNFFGFEPSGTPRTSGEIAARLSSDYTKIEKADLFGDVVVFRNPVTKGILQGGVLIADDILYTKSGPSILQPFTLLRQSKIERRWHRAAPPLVEHYRLKELPLPTAIPRRVHFKDTGNKPELLPEAEN